MPILTRCSSCGRQLRVPDNLLGRLVKCPACQNTFTAQAAEEDAPVAPAEEERPARPSRGKPESEGYGVEETPRRRPVRVDDDEDDDEPPEDDDYEDEPRPRRRRRRVSRKPHRGTLILILGILSLVICGLLGPVAWVMGNADIKEIDAGRMDPEGRGTTQAGRIMGIVSTAFMILGCVGYGLMFALMGAGGLKH